MEAAAAADAAVTLADTKQRVVEALPADPVRVSIERLKEEQAKCRARKKEIAKAMRNEKRKQARLRKRARQMTDDDLVSVLMMRKQRAVGRNDPVDPFPPSSSASSTSTPTSGASASTTPADAEERPADRTADATST